MSIVRLRPNELVVSNSGPWTESRRSAGQIFHIPAPPHITDEDIELTIWSEFEDATIVIATTLERTRLPIKSRLQCAQHDNVLVEGQASAVPDIAVYPIAQQRSVGKHSRVRAGGACRPVEIDPMIGGELRMQGHPQQSTLRTGVHR